MAGNNPIGVSTLAAAQLAGFQSNLLPCPFELITLLEVKLCAVPFKPGVLEHSFDGFHLPATNPKVVTRLGYLTKGQRGV